MTDDVETRIVVCIPKDITDIERAADAADREAALLLQLGTDAPARIKDIEDWASRLRLMAKRMEGK